MHPTEILPDYPRIRHLCYKPNAQRLDLIATEEECNIIFESDNIEVTEKVDAANAGICLFEGNPLIRNRNHIFQKGKHGHFHTPAKTQFNYIWNWFYEHQEKFENLNNLHGSSVSVFGEWLWACHGIQYDKLPSYFMAFDLYDWEENEFIATKIARHLLEECKFSVVPLLHKGKVPSWEFLEKFCQEKSPYSTKDNREGICVKVSDEKFVTHRFKMVRQDFVQGCHWSKNQITKNTLS
jgi:atypical dual specificity phosphatase